MDVDLEKVTGGPYSVATSNAMLFGKERKLKSQTGGKHCEVARQAVDEKTWDVI